MVQVSHAILFAVPHLRHNIYRIQNAPEGGFTGICMIYITIYVCHLGNMKIADLVILESKPLEDIHNTLAVDLVMKGGVAWYARDLVEAWPEPGVPLPVVSDEERVLERGSRAVEHWDQE